MKTVVHRLALRGAMLLVLISSPSLSLGQTYSFVNIADTTGVLGGFAAFPSMNNFGSVAFDASFDVGHTGVFKGPDPIADLFASSTGAYNVFGKPLINGAGRIVFQAQLDSNARGIFDGPDPSTDIVVAGFSDIGPIIDQNESGTVAFFGEVAGKRGIFNGPDPVANAVADSNGAYSFFNWGPEPAINDVGTVAFSAETVGGTRGIFTGSDPAAHAVVTNTGPYSLFFHADINDSGTVVFKARLDAGGEGVFRGPNPSTDAIATTAGPYFEFSAPMINDAGGVAFVAQLDSGQFGLFTGPDPVTNKIIAGGDALFGSSLLIVNSLRGLNDRGDIIFQYDLADGRKGVAVALIPEPGSAFLCFLGFAGLFRGPRRSLIFRSSLSI